MEHNDALIKNGNWYNYPEIYNIFSFAEDKDNKCIKIVEEYIKNSKMEVINPVDLGTGTGKMFDQLIKNINYEGSAYLVDSNKKMTSFLRNKYHSEVIILNSKISDFSIGTVKSNLIISSFGFPSNLFDRNNCIKELKNVYENLSDGGVFITIGLNEKWNDELSLLWKTYIDKDIKIYIRDVRNCKLNWYENDIKTTLRFDNKKQMKYVIFNLFGSKAKVDYTNSDKLEWKMKMGITLNTKTELKNIIKKLENE